MLARNYLIRAFGAKDATIREGENGHSAQRDIICPLCGGKAVQTACSDVGGAWSYCTEAGCSYFDDW